MPVDIYLLKIEDREGVELPIVSEYTDFFYHKSRINLSIHTRKNNYGNALLMFLNFVFFERETPVESINDITIELGNEFINAYGIGDVGDERIKSNDSIKKVESSLTAFYHWLCYQQTYKLKYVKRSIFSTRNVRYHQNMDGHVNKPSEKSVLNSIFTVEYHDKARKEKLERPSEYIVYTLIELAKQYDPIMAFPIAMGAFAGLRRGEICQLCRQRIRNTAPYGRSICFLVDLRSELVLRADGVRTGQIKRTRVQLVYESFLPYLDKLYREHLEVLKKFGKANNKYGALLIDANGNAMTTHTFALRFQNLVLRLLDRTNELTLNNHVEATLNLQLLLDYKMTSHSLRYFFSEYVAARENTHTLASYRGDLNMSTALTYLKKSANKAKYIQRLQDSFREAYELNTGKKLAY